MRNVAKLAILGTGAAVAAGTALLARSRIAAAAAGIASFPGSSAANPLPVPSSDGAAKRVPILAESIRRMWPVVTGEKEISPAALELALSVAWLESGVALVGAGGWWKDKSSTGSGNMIGSGNIGARHCGKQDTGGAYYKCVEYGDSVSTGDGTQVATPDTRFRFYTGGKCGGADRSAQDCATYDFLYDITQRWPALAELKSGDLLGYAMRQGPKYRSDDAPNQKVFGRLYAGGNGYYGGFGDPKKPRDKQMELRVGGYARAMLSHIPAIAFALGHKRVHARIPAELLAPAKPKTPPAVAGAELGAIDVVVPAHNEESTVAGVVRALILAGTYERVIVVDDGSTDHTAARARAAGAEVITLPTNRGKMAAMLAGATESDAPAIAFFDADAVNMAPEHGRTLARAFRGGDYVQVCGTLDSGPLNSSRLATGQRIVDRRILDRIPITCRGYSAETAVNYVADRLGRTHEVPLAGLKFRTKAEKVGPLQGLAQGARMAGQMLEARVALAASGGSTCELGAAPEAPADPPPLEGVIGTTITVIAILAGALIVAAAVATNNAADVQAAAEKQAAEVLALLRAAGFDYVLPGDKARKGWSVVPMTDSRLLDALAVLTVGKRGEVLTALAAKGYGIQAKGPTRIKLPKKGTPRPRPLPELEEDRLPYRVLQKSPAAASSSSSTPASSAPAIEEDRAPTRAPAAAPADEALQFERMNPDGTTTPLAGEDDVTQAAAAATDAYNVARAERAERANMEGITGAAVAATVAGGIVAGALVAAAASKLASGTPAPPPAPAAAKAPAKGAAPIAKAPTPKAAPPPQNAEPYGPPLPPIGPPPPPDPDPEPSAAPMGPAGPVLAGDAGDVLMALHLSGMLPRARALPETGRIIWYVETQSADTMRELAGAAAELPGDELEIAGAGDPCPCGQPCGITVQHVHAFCPENRATPAESLAPPPPFVPPTVAGEEPEAPELGTVDDEPEPEAPELGKARAEKPDKFDDAMSTASDITTIATSAISALQAGKNLATRATDPDPACRNLVREWVQRHPWLARFTSPDLTKLAGTDAAPTASHAEMVERYLDTLTTLRGGTLGAATTDCGGLTAEEDRAVLAELGATQKEVDAIYDVAATTTSSIANLFVPGIGTGIRKTADAVKDHVNPEGKKPPPKKKAAKPADAACRAELATAQNDVALAKQWVQRHPILVALTSPSLARLAGEESDTPTPTGRTALASGLIPMKE